MKNKIFLFSVILTAAIILFVSFGQGPELQVEKRNLHKISGFDESQFILGIDKAEKSYGEITLKKLKGGIVPHHMVASHMIAGFFQGLSAEKPQKIIIVGPNHEEKGAFKVLTGSYDWETPYGIVESDLETLQRLLSANLASIDDTVLPEDQAVSAILPFIEFYMPYAKVTPLLLSSRLTENEIGQLADELSILLKEKDTVLIASVDFSHYLSFEHAEKNDRISLDAIQKGSCGEILKLDSGFMDSPPSVCTLMKAMKNTGTTDMEILDHSNSYKILGVGETDTTSYFSIYYGQR
jgi:AmmeMemoRadiSam system protein B